MDGIFIFLIGGLLIFGGLIGLFTVFELDIGNCRSKVWVSILVIIVFIGFLFFVVNFERLFFGFIVCCFVVFVGVVVRVVVEELGIEEYLIEEESIIVLVYWVDILWLIVLDGWVFIGILLMFWLIRMIECIVFDGVEIGIVWGSMFIEVCCILIVWLLETEVFLEFFIIFIFLLELEVFLEGIIVFWIKIFWEVFWFVNICAEVVFISVIKDICLIAFLWVVDIFFFSKEVSW